MILFFICVPFLILGKLWYDQSMRLMEQNAVNTGMQAVRQISGGLDSYMEGLENLTLPFLTHHLTQKFIKLTPLDEYYRFSVTRQIQEDLFPALNAGRKDIHNTIMTNTHQISASNLGAAYSLERSQAYLQLSPAHGRFGIEGISRVHGVPVISVYRLIASTLNFQPAGVLMLDLNLSEITRIVSNFKYEEDDASAPVSIVDTSHRYVYHPDQQQWGEPIPATLSQRLDGSYEGYFFEEIRGVQTLTVYYRSTATGWTTLSYYPIREMTALLIQQRNISVIVGLSLIGLALLLVGGYSMTLTRALLRLKNHMNRAENGDLTSRADDRRNDELGSLNRSFNKMLTRIQQQNEVIYMKQLQEKELQIQQKDSRLLAMQSQINPHFLYNSLEIINSYAILEGNTSISKMTASLARLFRYNSQDGTAVVSLEEELQHITTYLSIQKERYSELKTVLEAEPNDLMQVKVPRFTLQPLVENAFKHGYDKPMLPPSYLAITGRVVENHYCVHITDHGHGMSPEKMDSLNQQFEKASSSDSSRLAHASIGLWNVHSRIVLHFGSPYGLRFIQSSKEGTTVELRLPMNKQLYYVPEGC
ncbi:ATPase/histidine kinase/DNA gyrase B/HSP90 domain protein [Paenibacillus algicola]|uniref:ATPase/histidine kinase/DNA gyrase B/HSP90 domain protein n=2 Tax=Paenibacillus algicola TaxID=2565926 RepID=A0A4P8XHC4_9BACL|nr:ATPase/histidine kinase/DNA gyrase B/HSP90 domain protein [Paenibacillus algicola]